MLTFDELWEKLLAGDESVSIEVKHGRAIGKAVLETISAFSNEPGQDGGYLMLGVEEKPTGGRLNMFEPSYSVVGLADAAQLQSDLVTQCRNDMEPPVSPETAIHTVEGKKIVVAHIPEAEVHAKPVFIKAKGVQQGSFRRIGSSDIKCTAEDIEEFFAARQGRTFDQSLVADATLNDIDPKAVAEYRRLRKEVKPDAPELAVDDDELLQALGAVRREGKDLRVTVAGAILFCKPLALRRLYPMHRVDYIRVPGRIWVENPEERYSSVEFLEPLVLSIPRIVAQVFDDIPKAFSLPEGTPFRKDIPDIPYKVVREAVVNAVMHRNYRFREPLQIIRFANRLEVRNPGYSLVPEERLGTPGSPTRNPHIAAVLHELNLAENKGTGISTMRRLMLDANLSAPAFLSDRVRDSFTVTLLTHHLLDPADVEWLASFKDLKLSEQDAKALIVLREIGGLNNSLYRAINSVDTLAASKGLQRLHHNELIERRGQGNATYYEPAQRFVDSLRLRAKAGTPQLSGGNSPTKTGNSPTKGENSPTNGDVTDVPAELEAAIESLGRRAKPEALENIIVALCAIRPRRIAELRRLLGRTTFYLLSKFLRPMIDSGKLEYVHPEEPNHPQQAYRSTVRSAPPKRGGN
ncbi:MAG: putative DNA binding domain-containing protein [Planctomycetes bacterium]|nr:putative DNA binding domain-containing protein [Planctomycetota bacterium]